ncbi:hypothetical protein [Paenibacillus sp. HB172176]|nr:hypothetical protein [Paenibacillus sp. HB172176]
MKHGKEGSFGDVYKIMGADEYYGQIQNHLLKVNNSSVPEMSSAPQR